LANLLFVLDRIIDEIMLDDTSRAILRHLQADPAIATPDLAERLRLSPSTVTRRIERMREDGHIKGRKVLIDWVALGYEIHVSLRIRLDKTNPRAFDDFLTAARDIPEVLEIQTFLGRVDVRLSVIARTLADYQQIYRRRILALPHIDDIESLLTVSTVQDRRALPL